MPSVVAPEFTRPQFFSSPPSVSSSGAEAVELAASAGLILDDWQAWALDQILAERADGTWASFEAAVIVPRQNGKGALLEALSLAGLFLLDEHLILHSAHEFKTASEGFRRLTALLRGAPHLWRRVERVTTGAGNEAIELTTGQRLRYVARSSGSGRGFSGDRVILDEAYALTSEEMAALLPTLSARPNPQLIYTSSAGMEASTHLRAVRDRGRAGNDPSLAYMEWCAPVGPSGAVDLDDPAGWAAANPGLGIRISEEFISRERRALDDHAFARERLGVWDEPSGGSPIPQRAWLACADPEGVIVSGLVLCVDVALDRRHASIGAAGLREDGVAQVEVADYDAGTEWVVDRLRRRLERNEAKAVVFDPGGPVGSLKPELESLCAELQVPLVEMTARDQAQACGALHDDVVGDPPAVRHLDDPVLTGAVVGAAKRDLADAWAFSRKKSGPDISPLVAVTGALWGLRVLPDVVDPLSNIF